MNITRKNKQNYKTTLVNSTVPQLKAIARGLRLKRYSHLRKADLIDLILSRAYSALPDLTTKANSVMGTKPTSSHFNKILKCHQKWTVIPFGPFLITGYDLDEDGFIDFISVSIASIEYYTLTGTKEE